MAAALKQRSFETALSATLDDLDLGFSLKHEQIEALKSFIFQKDVFAALPTGYGKSLIYQLAPVVAKRMGLSENPLVVIVSPLIALMEDQVKEASKLGLTAMQLGVHTLKDIRKANCQLIFGSPEAWLMQSKWREMLSTKTFRNNLLGIVVDEVHLIYKWGKADKGHKAFRECFAKLGELRSIVRRGTPILALTATADLDSRAIIQKQLHFEDATQVTVSPNRKNIRLGLIKVSSHTFDCLDWIVRELKEHDTNMFQVIIYCRTLTAVGRVFCYLKAELGEDCWADKDPQRRAENLRIGMFHSHTLPQNKRRILDSFGGDGPCRVVVATSALGMGLNFPKISHVVMYGVPEDMEAILQEAGRAGRDGSLSHAVIYRLSLNTNVDEGLRTLLKNSSKSCFRKALFSQFENNTDSVVPGHLCCTYCHSVCSCTSAGCDMAVPKYEQAPLEVSAPGQIREVTEDEKDLIRNLLHTYKLSLIPETHLYTNSTYCTGFSDELINSVLEHCAEIFDLNFIMNNLPVFSKRHAQEILRILFEVFEDFKFTELDFPPEDFVVPDPNYMGYFDEDTEGNVLSQCSSLESGLSALSTDSQNN
ncbi:probable ATP-dependent DNA helicase RecS [Nothobranchius furzeri]|uniref:probable ATP-dependent DNA helicase RecS n=1 Tax=Nothobranchius furzeri TaxID=105023 RepID=UPI00240425A0|nr:bifunctional 3'-5' exonuclease/ATP-dependent helicase WRN-like [Nothobranchius furzeri]